jgi:hypothetical protein
VSALTQWVGFGEPECEDCGCSDIQRDTCPGCGKTVCQVCAEADGEVCCDGEGGSADLP